MERNSVWTAWLGSRGYPYNASEEAEFVAALHAADGSDKVTKSLSDRHMVTALLSALRDGASIDLVKGIGAGIPLRAMGRVYDDLDHRIRQANQAWAALVDAGTAEALALYGHTIVQAMPQPIHLLREHADAITPDTLNNLSDEVLRVRGLVRDTEEAIWNASEGAARMMVGLLLTPGNKLLDHQFFLPERVGQLTPARVAMMLGELR